MKNYLIPAIAFIVGAVLAFGIITTTAGHPSTFGDASNYFNQATNAGVSCGTSSTLAIATSTARQYLALVNDSSSTIYISLGGAANGSTGIRLNAQGGSYETMAGQNIFTGAVYCIASSSAQMTILQA